MSESVVRNEVLRSSSQMSSTVASSGYEASEQLSNVSSDAKGLESWADLSWPIHSYTRERLSAASLSPVVPFPLPPGPLDRSNAAADVSGSHSRGLDGAPCCGSGDSSEEDTEADPRAGLGDAQDEGTDEVKCGPVKVSRRLGLNGREFALRRADGNSGSPKLLPGEVGRERQSCFRGSAASKSRAGSSERATDVARLTVPGAESR